jgi:hypothetical protein
VSPLASRPGWTFGPFAERALYLALASGTIAATLFVGLNGLAPTQRPTTFAQAFLRWSLAFYAAFGVLALLAAWLVIRLLRGSARKGRWGRWPEQAALALAAAWVLGACALANERSLDSLLHLDGPARFRWLAPLALLAAGGNLVICALLSPARRLAPRVLTAVALVSATGAFAAPGAPPALRPPLRPASAREAARGVLVLAVDGADWTLMEPLLARGELPHLAALRARGAWGPLATIVPTRSPAIWTTIATGQPPQKHGIESFTNVRVEGVHGVLRRSRKPRGLGFDRLFSLLESRQLVLEGPVTSSARRVPAFWNLATAEGSPVAMVGWWGTWPAEPVLGAVVSERVHYWRDAARGAPPEDSALTFPDGLHDEIAGLVLAPDEVTYGQARPFLAVSSDEFRKLMAADFRGKTAEGEFKYLYSMFETSRRISLALVPRTSREFGRPADLLVLFRIVDIASHAALGVSELVEDHLGASEADRRKFGGLVSEAYRSVDRALGELMAAMGG